jgi:hypothetical protein
MFAKRFLTVLIGIALAAVLVLTVQEAIAISAVTSNAEEALRMERSRDANAARWEAMGEYYRGLAEAQNLERSRTADTTRWKAMAEYYQSVAEAQNLVRSRAADSARWTAMAEYYK